MCLTGQSISDMFDVRLVPLKMGICIGYKALDNYHDESTDQS